MTALDLIALNEAERQYATARRSHERLTLVEYRAGHTIRSRKSAEAVKRLARYAPSETIVVRQIPEVQRYHDGREGAWPE